MPAAVDARGLVLFPGEIAHELRHGKDEERVRGEIFPEPQRNISVDQIEFLEEHVPRDDAHWKGSTSVEIITAKSRLRPAKRIRAKA